MNKHSSLARKFVNYGQKCYYNIGPPSPQRLCNGEVREREILLEKET